MERVDGNHKVLIIKILLYIKSGTESKQTLHALILAHAVYRGGIRGKIRLWTISEYYDLETGLKVKGKGMPFVWHLK